MLAADSASAYPCAMARADCPVCGGSGWKVVERTTEGAQPLAAEGSSKQANAVAEPKRVWAVPCDCTATDPASRADRELARAGIPQRYWLCDFDSFETDNDYEGVSPSQMAVWNRSLSQAKMTVQAFVREFPTCTDLGLILMGNCGVGKTHLAVAALKEIVLRGHSGLFCDYGDLLKKIQNTYNPETPTEMSVLDPVVKTEVLLLDDVGSSKPSYWALETVGYILTTRYNEKRFTILTTNFLDEEIRDKPERESAMRAQRNRGKQGPPPDLTMSRRVITLPSGELDEEYTQDTFEKRVGVRIRSRLYEMCRTVTMRAPDRRKYVLQHRRLD